MSGRAGRRGLDNTGMVIIACSGDEAPEVLLTYHKESKGFEDSHLAAGIRSINNDPRSSNKTGIAVPLDI